MRLLLVSLFAYLISLIFKRSETWRKTSGLISVFLVAIIFGISHLPVMAMMSELSWLMISRVIILNALGGLVFGYLYLRRGLVYAMTAHFLADLVLQVLFPLFYY